MPPHAPAQAHRFDDPSTTGSAPDTIGRYRLLSKIAKGGMAEVFAARSYGAHGFEKTVALKRILPRFGHDPQFVRMMVDEAKISVLLNHPNIAQIFELGEQDSDYFIVMEFVPGQSVAALVKRLREENQRLPVLDACFLVVELLQGLHAAHTQRDASGAPANIIHRDVSPQNTLLSFDGHVKVIDFGIARARDRLEATEVGTIKGKLRYLAPEMIDPGRFTKNGDFDHRVDVFAAGIVLWELLAARPMFPGEEELKVYDDITDGKTPDLHKEGRIDQALMRIVNQSLERQLNKRYATAEAFADDLRAYVYRTDPSYTHKRLAALLDKLFPAEKANLLALERGVVGHHPTSTKPAPKPMPAPMSAQLSEAATARVDVNEIDPAGLLKDVAVVTIVSRQMPVNAAAPSSGGSVFTAAEDATLTVGAGDPRAQAFVAAAVSKTGPTAELPRKKSPAPPATRDTMLDDVPATTAAAPTGRRKAVVAASAVLGVVVALLFVAVIDRLSPSKRAPALVPTPVATPAPATVPPPLPVPAPTLGAVPVLATVVPATARVVVNGVLLSPTTTVLPGALVRVEVSAEGFVSQELTLTATPSTPLTVVATLVAEDVPAVPSVEVPAVVEPTTSKPQPSTKPTKPDATTTTATKPAKQAEAKATGTLVLKTTPWWGNVEIDGQAQEDTTPLTLTLSAGRHDVVVTHPPKGLTKRFKVVVLANDTVVRVINFE
jgi:serine/threonine protein kinase